MSVTITGSTNTITSDAATINVSKSIAVTGTVSATTGAAIGGATPGTGGLAFPATAVAVADANTLDDYEEGTWTPVLTFTTPGTLSITYDVQSGVYTKVGRVVELEFYILIGIGNFVKGTASGTMQITGLPFASNSAILSYYYFDLAASSPDFTASNLTMGNLGASASLLAFEKMVVSGANVNRGFAVIAATDFGATNGANMSITGRITYSI